MAADVPDKAGEFPGDGGDCGFVAFRTSHEFKIVRAQPLLCVPGAFARIIGNVQSRAPKSKCRNTIKLRKRIADCKDWRKPNFDY